MLKTTICTLKIQKNYHKNNKKGTAFAAPINSLLVTFFTDRAKFLGLNFRCPSKF